MSKKQRFRGLFVFVSAFFIMCTAVLSNNIDNNIMKAEAVFDDGPSGEKIVDIQSGAIGLTTGGLSNYALTENGNIYAWGSNINGQLGNGSIGGDITKPTKVLNAVTSTDGNKYLSNVKRIFASGYDRNGSALSGGIVFALTDSTLYGWGSNYLNAMGLPNNTDYLTPTEIPLPNGVTVNDISDIAIGTIATHTMLITKSGDVYTSGNTASGSLGLGPTIFETNKFTKLETMDGGIAMPKIMQIKMDSENSYFLTESGRVMSSGRCLRSGTGCLEELYYPTYMKINDSQYLEEIESLLGTSQSFMVLMKSKSGEMYVSQNPSSGINYATPLIPSTNIVDEYNVFQNLIYFDTRSTNGGIFIGEDNKLYTIQGYNNTGFMSARTYTVKPYNQGEVYEGYDNANKVVSSYGGSLILSNDGGVYHNGVKLSFGDILLSAKKKDTSSYKSLEKYNGDVTLSVAPSSGDISKILYNEKDLTTKTSVTAQSAIATMDFVVEEDKRIYKEYEFYLTGEEADTKITFTVDLYKKPLTLTDVREGSKYAKGKKIKLPANHGFAENTVSATISKDGATATAYASETPINEAGNYSLTATDLYGNNVTYNFAISDKPIAESVEFAKTASGELTYDNTITKPNNIIGTLSLKYPAGQTASTIKTLTIGTENDGASFEVANTNQLKVKGSQLTAKDYVVPVSGTDQNDMPFDGEVTITIAKATQTMAWDVTSSAYGTNGMSIGDTATLGVKDLLGSATVTYSLKSANSCVTMNNNKATITCMPSPSTVTFVATPSGNDNYTSTPIELNVSVAKKAITLNVELKDGTVYKNDVSIKLGDSLPEQRITCSDSSVDVSTLGTPTYAYKKNGATVINPSVSEGVYTVNATYPAGSSADNYTITWSGATLRVDDITLEEDDYKDYFTMTSGGKTYTQDTWTKDTIIIRPIHANFTKMDVDDAGSPSTGDYTYDVEGSNNVKLSFYNAEGAKISVTIPLKYDKTKPVMQANTYENASSKLRSMLRAITFNQYFKEEQKVAFHATDTGSGLASFEYEIIELDKNVAELAATKMTGTATPTEQILLLNNKNYKLTVKPVDTAGNIGDAQIETVQLSDQVAVLNVTAKNGGVAYDGTKWVSSAIDFTVKSTSTSGVEKYQYATNGTTFTDFTSSDGTITLPSPVTNQNNVTYTFQAINSDGSTCKKTYQVKLDATKPIIEVKGKVNGSDYDGSEVDQDVSILLSQTNSNISGIKYYYTTVSSAKDSDPTTNASWKAYSGTFKHTTSGNVTYYFKGVSGAGLISDVVSLQVKVSKKEYTPVTVVVTSEGKAYTPDTWAKGDVTFKLSGGIADTTMITGYEYAVTTGAKPTATSTWKAVTGTTLTLKENIKGQTYYFRVLPKDNLGSISKGTIVKLDIEKPSTPVIIMKELNTNPIAKLVNAISFGNWMKESVEVTITSTDTISGIEQYKYSETINGVKTDKVSNTGVITYDKDTKITFNAIAVDKAGNESDICESKEVMIDKEPPEIIGVKDQGEYKHYYLPRFIHMEDKLSGVKEATIQKGKEVVTPFTDEISVKEIGTYTIKASDNAENEITLIFKIIPLPSLDEIDGSDESKDIIDQVIKELDEIKDKIDETEKKDYEDWIKDATDKWESLRKKVVEDDEKTSKVEGIGDTSFDPKTELIVDPIEEDTLPVLPRRAMYSYDVYLKKGTTVVQPNGEIKVYLPYPDDAKPIIYEIDKEGNVREIAATKEGNYVVFTTKTLMKYAISNTEQEVLDPDDKPVNPDDPNKPSNPDDPNKPDDPKDPETPDKDVNHDSDGDGKADVNVDVDCDGKADINIDTDGDGLPDINIDTTGDGKPNYNVDLDGDKEPDLNIGPVKWKTDKCVSGGCVLYCTSTYYKPYLNIDSDGDNRPDINIDLDKDKAPDINIDLDNDNIPDLNIDTNGDGKADINIDEDDDGWPDKNLALILKWKPDKDVDQPMNYDTMSGIVVDESLTPDTWHPSQNGKDQVSGGGNSNDANGNTGGSTNQSPSGVGGTLTGDSNSQSFVWIIFVISGIISCISYRLRKNAKMNS